MPFKSKAQRAYLEIHDPKVAKEFAEHTPAKEEKRLPEHMARENTERRKPTKK
jgi:hypothetical protein